MNRGWMIGAADVGSYWYAVCRLFCFRKPYGAKTLCINSVIIGGKTQKSISQ